MLLFLLSFEITISDPPPLKQYIVKLHQIPVKYLEIIHLNFYSPILSKNKLSTIY